MKPILPNDESLYQLRLGYSDLDLITGALFRYQLALGERLSRYIDAGEAELAEAVARTIAHANNLYDRLLPGGNDNLKCVGGQPRASYHREIDPLESAYVDKLTGRHAAAQSEGGAR